MHTNMLENVLHVHVKYVQDDVSCRTHIEALAIYGKKGKKCVF